MLNPLFKSLELPLIVAPMFLVSGVNLLVNACRGGVVGSIPALNLRSSAQFESLLEEIEAVLAEPGSRAPAAPYAVNLSLMRMDSDRFREDLAAIKRHRVPVVITSSGSPAAVVPEIQGYGGIVLHDVISIRHAKKAAEAGVDGLILVAAGAGGHAGVMNPFAFVPQVRSFFKKTVVLAGGISDGRGIKAALTLGADLVYMGTRFIATQESLASEAYKSLLLENGPEDVIYTSAFSGVHASFLKSSIRRAGLDPDNLPRATDVGRPDLPPHIKPWRDVWSAGQGIGSIDDLPSVTELLGRLKADFYATRPTGE
jgi:nitronate monooxygenase